MSAAAAPRIAVIGAGPTGLEAALLGRALGYSVTLYEAGSVAHNIRDWGQARLFTPWSLNVSALGERLLLRQALLDAPLSARSDCPTGHEFREQYLLPLTRLPELVGVVQEHTRVVSIGRSGFLKGDSAKQREGTPFRLLLESERGESTASCEILLDATGVYGHPNPLGRDGIPAPGERAAARHILTGLPDIEARRADFIGKRILVVGGGHSAATTVIALSELPETSVTWVTRRLGPPLTEHPGDALPERGALDRAANQVAADHPAVRHIGASAVERIDTVGDTVKVLLASPDGFQEIEVDRIINQTGFRPDREMHREMQIHECYETEGPIKLAAALGGTDGGDCMTQVGFGADSLKNPEPGYYIVGHKSYGRNPDYLMRIGREQLRDLYRVITGDAHLDPDVLEPVHVG